MFCSSLVAVVVVVFWASHHVSNKTHRLWLCSSFLEFPRRAGFPSATRTLHAVWRFVIPKAHTCCNATIVLQLTNETMSRLQTLTTTVVVHGGLRVYHFANSERAYAVTGSWSSLLPYQVPCCSVRWSVIFDHELQFDGNGISTSGEISVMLQGLH